VTIPYKRRKKNLKKAFLKHKPCYGVAAFPHASFSLLATEETRVSISKIIPCCTTSKL